MKTLKALFYCFLAAFAIVALPHLLLGILIVLRMLFFPVVGLLLLVFIFHKKKASH